MPEIEYREYQHEDAESFLRLHDAVFPPIQPEAWREWSRSQVTASVAVLGGEVVGTVPFHFRNFRVRPASVVRLACEYSVCVREDLRGKRVGRGLMDEAKRFLRGRALAMMVYRGDERSYAYHYYHNNGHHDLTYLRSWVRRDGSPDVSAGGVEAAPWDGFLAREEEYLSVFRSAYGAYGGYPERGPGYYGPAVRTAMYDEVPLEITVLSRRSEEGVLGYAIVGEERRSPTLHLLELATVGNDLSQALPLLATYAAMAAQRGLPLAASMPDSSPYVPALRALGFEPQPRSRSSTMIMAHVLDPESLAEATWRENEGTMGLEVQAWTPERQAMLHRTQLGHGRPVLLEMKEETLTRLLFGRLDLESALAQEIVTAGSANAADIRAIAQALPFSPWAYHQIDFI